MNLRQSLAAPVVTAGVIIVGIVVGTTACTVPNLPPPLPVTSPTLVPASPSTLAVDTEPSAESRPQASTAAPTQPTPATSRTSDATSPANPPPLTAPDVATLVGKVVSVYDGDTFTVTIEGEKESIRPLGIDAPELENDNLGITGECYGPQSKDAAKALLTGTTVRLTVDPEQGDANDDYRDDFGRLLRYVEVPLDTPDITTATAAVDFGDYQLRNGNAWVFEQYPVARTPGYEQEMQVAQTEHEGLWAACE